MTENHFYSKAVYYIDNLAGVNFLPTEYVDISETIEMKIQNQLDGEPYLGVICAGIEIDVRRVQSAETGNSVIVSK
jgi:hypothetical protein